MAADITRRDFLNGAALAIAAGLSPIDLLQAQASAPHGNAPYPPAGGGLRGSAPGSFDIAHALRDGRRFATDGIAVDERYDLIVVGAGISGLAAAWFYRREKPNARILLLEANDDFGGHAQRNEFLIDGRLFVSYGGSESMQSPHSLYSRDALGLTRALGIDLDRFETAFDRTLYPGLGLSRGVLFKREHFGADRLVTGDPMRMVADDIPPDRMNARPLAAFVADFPVSEVAKRQLVALYTSRRDPLPGHSRAQKEALLERTSYRDWITKVLGYEAAVADTFQCRTHDFFAAGIDAVPAGWAFEDGYPGFAGLGLGNAADNAKMDDPYIHHFPDGNASIARLLVRSLIAGVAPGHGMDDIVLAPFDYSRLDANGALIRLRLAATAIEVRERTPGRVEAYYSRGGVLHAARARHAVMACYHSMDPYLLPDLGAAQRAALALNVKMPLVYVKVLVRNWRPWVNRGVHEVTNAVGFHSRLKLDYPVSLGDYRCPRLPDEPMVLHLVHVPTVPLTPGVDPRTTLCAARAQLLAMPFGTFEREARDELTRIAGAGGFDAERDIVAITVNRWGHGYSGGDNPLYDPPRRGAEPYEIARSRLGGIAFANSDSAWAAYAHAAIDEAHRAVGELLG
ncbi:MAG: FAD-dependent oxidoreductase [Steroidobacteraceae bacterium]